MIRILHLSDLHFVYQNYDQQIVLSSLLEELRISKEQMPIDIVIFSGDLVNSGEDYIQFAEAKKAFIDPVLAIYGLDSTRFFIVPGNHDISRNAVESNIWLEKGLLADLASVDKVSSFIDKAMSGDRNTEVAFNRLENYDKLLKTVKTGSPLIYSPTFQTHRIMVGNVSVGVACFNSAWRCTGSPNDADKGKLIIGERSIDRAIESVQGVDLALAIFHHPTEYLTPFEAEPVESRLLVGFDFLFYGHVHSTYPTIRQSPRGKAFFSQSGCLYHNRKYHNGFQIIEIDLNLHIGKVIAMSYFDGPRKFRRAVDVLNEQGEFSFDLPTRNNAFTSVNKFLTVVRPAVRTNANQHVTLAIDPEEEPDDIYEVFVCPPMRLGQKSKKVISESVVDNRDITIDTILSNTQNILLIGKRQSSKSSVGHYLAVKFSEGLGDIVRIPLVLDARSIKPNNYNFQKASISYFSYVSLNQTSLANALDEFPLVIILDNFDEENDRHLELLQFLLDKKQTRIICIANEPKSAEFINATHNSLLDSFQEIRLEPLPRKSIRQLSSKRTIAGKESADVFGRVMTNLVSAQLPWNGYIVSLLLWAHSQNKTFDNINESVLIEAIVNFLLEKGDFAGAFRKSFDSRSKEITLQAIAVFFTHNNDTVTEQDLFDFVFDFFKKKGLSFSTPDTIRRLIDIGILAGDGENVSFRFRAFQEYFFACAMKEDDDLRRTVSDLKNIPFYSREIDLFTANTRKSLGFMHTTLEWIEAIRMQDNRLAKNQDLETAQFSGTGHIGFSAQRKRALKRDPLTIDQIDEALERAEQLALKRHEARRAEIVNSKNGNGTSATPLPLTTNLFLSIETLGKILRNSEFDDVGDKIAGIEFFIDFCQEICMTVFQVFDEAVSIIRENMDDFPIKFSDRDFDNMKNVIKAVMPLSLTAQMAEQIGTEKLIEIFENILKERCETFGKRFFLSCLLFDLRGQGSISRLLSLAKDNVDTYRRHIILDKLALNYSVRRFREVDEIELQNAIADIEILLGADKNSKGASIEARRSRPEI